MILGTDRDMLSSTFLGFVPSLHQMRSVAKLQHRLYGHLPLTVRDSLTWVPPLSFAVVVRYLGTASTEYLDLLRLHVQDVLPDGPVVLEPQGVQPLFTQEGRPVLFYLSLADPSGRVDALASSVETFLEETGFGFSPQASRLGILLAKVPDDLEEGILSYIESFRPQLPKPMIFDRMVLGMLEDHAKGVEPIHFFELGGNGDGKEE